MKSFHLAVFGAGIAALVTTSTALAAPIYDDTFVSSQFITNFGSADVTGAPDGGGKFLGDTFDPPANPGYIIVKFSAGLVDGVGDDLFVTDVGSSSNETADLFVSADNLSYTFVGQLNAVANQLDIAGAFAGTFYYVKVANASTRVSIDIDTVGGYHAAAVVPEPSTYALFGAGLAVLAGLSRRRRT